MNSTLLRFANYARRSSEGEGKQVASIPAQESAAKALVERDQLNVAKWLSEDRSAMIPNNRPVFDALITMLKAGEVNAILCWHVDRLARNSLEAGLLQQLLHDGVIQCVKTPEREYRPGDHAVLFALETSMAVQYSRDLGRNVRRGTDDKAAMGWYPHSSKPGYMVERGTKHVVPCPEQFPLLRRAVELLLGGDLSVPNVLAQVNAMGYRTAKTAHGGNKPLSGSSLYRILHDPFYAGIFTYQGVQQRGKHLPLMTEDEFGKVQRILGRNLRSKPQQHFHAYAGLIRCGICGCQITAETKVKQSRSTKRHRTYTYYHCTGRKGCPKVSISEEQLDLLMAQKLGQCQLEPAFAEWAMACLGRDSVTAVSQDQVARKQAATSLNALSRKLDRLMEMREDQEISVEEFQAGRAKYQAQRHAIEQERARNDAKGSRDTATLKNLLSFSATAYTNFVHGSQHDKRAVARAFATGYVLTRETLDASVHPGLDTIRTFEPPKSQSQQIDSGGSGGSRSEWRARWEKLRKIVAQSDIPFEAPPDTVPAERLAA